MCSICSDVIIQYLVTAEDVANAVERGMPPRLPAKYFSTNDTYVIALVNVMKACYQFEPARRPHAKDVVKYLDLVLANS